MRISNLKKFYCKVSFFICCMIVVDFSFGLLFDFLRSHSKGGNTQKDYHVSEMCDADVLVLGSSRAQHHYVPEILDSLGGKSYNGGADGIGIVLGLGRYLMCSEKHVPKIVIYEVTPEFDYLVYNHDNSKYLSFLRPYYEKKGIKQIFDKIETPFDQLKMKSKMYRNSSRILANIADYIFFRPNNRGYIPLYGKLDISNQDPKNPILEIDSIKFSLLDQLIKETSKRGSRLYFAISPKFSNHSIIKNDQIYEPIISLAKKNNIEFFNNLNIQNLSDNPALFEDCVHLNDQGAKRYSHLILMKIKELN